MTLIYCSHFEVSSKKCSVETDELESYLELSDAFCICLPEQALGRTRITDRPCVCALCVLS